MFRNRKAGRVKEQRLTVTPEEIFMTYSSSVIVCLF